MRFQNLRFGCHYEGVLLWRSNYHSTIAFRCNNIIRKMSWHFRVYLLRVFWILRIFILPAMVIRNTTLYCILYSLFLWASVILCLFALLFILMPFLNSDFYPGPFVGAIQEWAATNETRDQIEDTVLYGYYSKCIFFIHVCVGTHTKKINFFDRNLIYLNFILDFGYCWLYLLSNCVLHYCRTNNLLHTLFHLLPLSCLQNSTFSPI